MSAGGAKRFDLFDLHVHTDASPCSRATPAEVVDAAVSADLDGIAVTDHDTLDGYEAVAALSPPELTVVPGAEVTTTQGHLLALGVEEVPPRADPLTVVADVHDQGGVAVLAHPFDELREHYADGLDEVADRVDAVEALNSRCILSRYNRAARSFAERHSLSVTGGSDAHFPMEVGRAYTACDGSALDAVRAGTTRPTGRDGYLSGHVATKLNDAVVRLSG